MVTLANIVGKSLVPDLPGAFASGGRAFLAGEALDERALAKEQAVTKREKTEDLLTQLEQPGLPISERTAIQSRLAAVNLELSKQIGAIIKQGSDAENEQAAELAAEVIQFTTAVMELPKSSIRLGVTDFGNKLLAQGRPIPPELSRIANLPVGDIPAALLKMQVEATDSKTLVDASIAERRRLAIRRDTLADREGFEVRDVPGVGKVQVNTKTGELSAVPAQPAKGKLTRRNRTIERDGKFFEITENVDAQGNAAKVSEREVFSQFRIGTGVDPASGELKIGAVDLSKIGTGEEPFTGIATKPQKPTGRLTEKQEITQEEEKGKLEETLNTIERIEQNLKVNPFVAGGTGFLQRLTEFPRKFAGQSRGIPATEFQNDMQFLALEAAPFLTGEKKISLEERKEVARLLGGLDVLKTKGDVLSTMRKLKKILKKAKGAKGRPVKPKGTNEEKLKAIFGTK